MLHVQPAQCRLPGVGVALEGPKAARYLQRAGGIYFGRYVGYRTDVDNHPQLEYMGSARSRLPSANKDVRRQASHISIAKGSLNT
jgi:hypothetical protein